MGDITELIEQANAGDTAARDQLFQALYGELRRIARARQSPHQRPTLLDTTSLVNECYLKLASLDQLAATTRKHFLAYAATTMRSIIVDYARARLAERRGGDADHVPLNTEVIEGVPAGEDEVLRVHEALEGLAKLEPRLAQVVEMRYFGGLTDEEIAVALDVADRTVRRDWEKARLLLADALRG